MILWKHVGHSIIELLRHNSTLICWWQTGQTNLNSFILAEIAFHIRAPLATGFLRVSFRVFVIEFYRRIPNLVLIRIHRQFNQSA